MNDSEPVPTTPRPAAPWVAWGLALCLVGPALVAVGLLQEPEFEYASDVGQPWLTIGAVAGAVGVFVLCVGVFYLVQHADRAAGVRYPAARLARRR